MTKVFFLTFTFEDLASVLLLGVVISFSSEYTPYSQCGPKSVVITLLKHSYGVDSSHAFNQEYWHPNWGYKGTYEGTY